MNEITPDSTVPEAHKRSIRSFVLRQGHMTAAQQRAIDTMWPQFGIDYQDSVLDLNQRFRQRPSQGVGNRFRHGRGDC